MNIEQYRLEKAKMAAVIYSNGWGTDAAIQKAEKILSICGIKEPEEQPLPESQCSIECFRAVQRHDIAIQNICERLDKFSEPINMSGHFPRCPKCGSCAWLFDKCSHCGEPIPSPTPVAEGSGGQDVQPVGDGLHRSCEGCDNTIWKWFPYHDHDACEECFPWEVKDAIRKNYTTKEPRK